MIKRYDATKDQMVELTQEYFDRLQAGYAAMCLYFSKNTPTEYKNYCENSYWVTDNKNV